MLTGFLTVIGGILSLVMFIMTRKAKRDDDPNNKLTEARNENAKLLTTGNIQGVNTRLAGLLDNRLP